MRKKIVAGNWKMNKNFQEGIELAMAIQQRLTNYRGNSIVVLIPPFVHISKIREVINHPMIKIGGQNCSNKASGAYTGEISAEMLSSSGADYVIIGHSERRQYFGETNELCQEKINLAIDNQLCPIYCIGETLEERNSNQTFHVIEKQLKEGAFGLDADDFSNIVLAYEPVWAIGTGLTATKEQAQEVHAFIRQLIENQYNRDIAHKTTILYGGSCKPSNAEELFSQPDVDGGLIGGASLVSDDFVNIVLANK
ncbi:MAG TPA: triose-phosphate isomerase [Salinivirgaceae bacterium]|nr:triose-phosphate isomerase [Salinivirgaceae bacterium]